MQISDDIQAAIDNPPDDLNDQGQAYFEDVGRKAMAIRETMDRYQTVSRRQHEALCNMLSGLEAWYHDDDDDDFHIPF